MDRKEFLSSVGLSAGTIIIASCFAGCSKANGSINAPTVDFTIDLSLPANAALNNAGGYLYSNGVIIAKTLGGNIIAVSQACTHQGVTVQYQSSSNRFYCPSHGATFNNTGVVTSGPANGDLKQYTVTVAGNIIRING